MRRTNTITLVLLGKSHRFSRPTIWWTHKQRGSELTNGCSEPYLERNDPDADCIKEALHKVQSKENTVGEIGVFPVRE